MFSEILPEALIWKPFSVSGYDYNFSGSLLYDEPVISDDIDDFGKASKNAAPWLHINSCIIINFISLIRLSGHFLKPWIWMFVAWKYCREEDKRRINLVRKIFFAHFEANEKILYKAAKISAQEALKKQLENKWNFEFFIVHRRWHKKYIKIICIKVRDVTK